MNLSIKIDKYKKQKLYIQLYEQIKNLILTDTLSENTKLCSIRTVSKSLNINSATVVKAYNMLENEGYIYKIPSSGCYVKPKNFLKNLDEETYETDSLVQYKVNTNINFASGSPDYSSFPVKDYKKCINIILDRDGGKAFMYQNIQGYLPLRKTICKILNNEKIYTSVENIQIVNGAQQALDLISKIIINPGDKVAVENPTYAGAISIFKMRKANIRKFKIDNNGINLEEFENFVIKNPIKLLYTMPNFQNPTGICWSEKNKKAILNLAQKYNFYILEDDCLSDLTFNKIKHTSIKAYDKFEKVIYIKSYSKLFMPGLRIGFMIFPKNISSAILSAKYASDISNSGLNQRAFNEYIKMGFWKNHINKISALYEKRYNLMDNNLNLLNPFFIKPYNNYGGLYFWLKSDSINIKKFSKKCIENGVSFLPGNIFFDSQKSKYLRLSFASTSVNDINKGFEIMKFLLNKNNTDIYYPLI